MGTKDQIADNQRFNEGAGRLPIPLGMECLVKRMIECGWVERDRKIAQAESPNGFNDWESALLACIEVASGV